MDGPPARLATSDDFSPYFVRAKEAVAGLPVRFLEVESPELRAVFEVYGALALGTVDSNAPSPVSARRTTSDDAGPRTPDTKLFWGCNTYPGSRYSLAWRSAREYDLRNCTYPALREV